MQLKQLAKETKLPKALEHLQKSVGRAQSTALNRSESFKNRSEEELAYIDELPADLVKEDFIRRDPGVRCRREFLLDYLKEVEERDSATEQALKNGTYISDDKLLSLQPKMKVSAQNSL